MRSRASKEGVTVNAFAGTHVITLGLGLGLGSEGNDVDVADSVISAPNVRPVARPRDRN